MNVLITSASRKVWLVRAFQEALAKEGGGRVIAVDASPTSAALYVADEHYVVPRSDDPAFLEQVSQVCTEREVRLLVPTRDEELPLFATQKAALARQGTTVMVSDPEAVRVCQDKLEFARFCKAQLIETPTLYEGAPPCFPVFVKPRVGKGGRGTFLARSQSELESALAFLRGDAVVQDYVVAPEFTIDLFADFSGTVISAVPRQRLLVVGGESFVSKTVKEPRLRDEAIRLARALQLAGHCTIQCFLDEDIVKFIEVNPRFGGAAALGFAAGVSTPHFLIRLLKGERLQPQLDAFREDLYMLRYTTDMFLEASSLSGRTVTG